MSLADFEDRITELATASGLTTDEIVGALVRNADGFRGAVVERIVNDDAAVPDAA